MMTDAELEKALLRIVHAAERTACAFERIAIAFEGMRGDQFEALTKALNDGATATDAPKAPLFDTRTFDAP